MTYPSRISARKRSAWRLGVAAVVFASLSAHARAADMPDDSWLRGSYTEDIPRGVRWDGVQLGAHVGAGSMDANFGNSSGPMVAYILRNTLVESEFAPSRWTTLPTALTNGQSYGGFIGYNVQWDDLVVGADIAYNRTSGIEVLASDTISRQFKTSDGFYNALTVSGTSSIKLIDYATFRARAGYAFGQFLPYAVLGVGVGRFNYANSTTVSGSGTDVSGGGGAPYVINQTLSDSKNDAFAAGFVAGLGMDVSILPNVFLRGEYEYIAFAPVNGIRTSLNTGRVGVGVRF